MAVARSRGEGGSDPLRTLERVVGVVVTLLVVLTCAVLASAAVGSGRIPGLETEVCVTTSEEDVPGFRRVEGERTGAVGLEEGITWRAEQVKICDPDPDGATRALAAVGLSVWLGAPLLFFGLLRRMLRRARRDGIHADQVPGALRRLGRLLLVWGALDVVVTGLVNAALSTRMTDGLVLFTSGQLPVLVVFLGIALLALGRVMAQAVDTRRDVEATT